MKEYLVIEYFADRKRTFTLITDEDELWNLIDDAKHTGRKIAVYELGKCLLDWS